MTQNARFDTALITGASSGLGSEFARQLAPHCSTLVLTARRTDRLESLAGELQSAVPGLSVVVIPGDLSIQSERVRLLGLLEERGIHPDLLINNAGLGDYGPLESSDWSKVHAMLAVNVEAMVHLTQALIPSLKKRGGGVINMGSLAGILAMPDFAVYAASKAFVASFSQAMHTELSPYGITVLNVAPGPVATEFGTVARRESFSGDLVPARDLFYTTPETVVSEALRALKKKRSLLFTGGKVRLIAFILRFIPNVVINAFMRRSRRFSKCP